MADSSFWEVENVEVKQEGQNSFVAKQKALSKSARSAFSQLFKENDDLKSFSSYAGRFSNRQIQDCVYDYSIENEKSSDSFYIAEFSYRFSKDKIAERLKRLGANIQTEGDNSGFTKVAIYKRDYLNKFKRFSRLHPNVLSFTEDKVVLEIRKINDFKKLKIVYVRL